MSKHNRNRKRIHIPGSNSKAVRVPQSVKNPNVAPTGTAFTPADASKHAQAVIAGIKQVLAVMGIQGFFLQFIIPCVEWRKDIVLPDGTKTDDFMMTGSGINPAICSAGQDPVALQVSQLLTPMLWKKTFNADMTSNNEALPQNLPDVPPPAAEPA